MLPLQFGHRQRRSRLAARCFNLCPASRPPDLAALRYASAYNTVFVGYGIIALVGLAIVLFLMGPLVPDKVLHDYTAGLKPVVNS